MGLCSCNAKHRLQLPLDGSEQSAASPPRCPTHRAHPCPPRRLQAPAEKPPLLKSKNALTLGPVLLLFFIPISLVFCCTICMH